jgi:hypothetical protein
MENALTSYDVMLEKGMLWLNALYVRKKSVHLRKHGKWLEEKTRAAREQN